MGMFKDNIVNALPYDIIRRIRQKFISSDDINDGKDSSYIVSKGKKYEIRVSNHCAHLWTWHERKNGDNNDITRVSIVFEESNTFEKKNLILRHNRKTPLRVMEFVYRISDPQSFTSDDVKKIIDSINRCIKYQVEYEDTTGKLSYVQERVSINPTNENKEYKTNTNIAKKQVIKITESKLKQIVAESVKKVLNENEEGYWKQLLNEVECVEEMLSPIFENNKEVSEEEMFNLLLGCYSSNNRIKNLIHEGRRYYSQL